MSDDIVLWFALIALIALGIALVCIAWVVLGDWRYQRRRMMMDDLERSRKALVNMPPITVRIGTPLYDWELEDVS